MAKYPIWLRREAFQWGKRECVRLRCEVEPIELIAPEHLAPIDGWYFSLFYDEGTGEALYRIDDLEQKTTTYKRVMNFPRLRFQRHETINYLLEAGISLYKLNMGYHPATTPFKAPRMRKMM